MTLDDPAIYGDDYFAISDAAAAADTSTPKLSLVENLQVIGLKTEAGILDAGASVIGYVGKKLTALGQASEDTKTTITTTASNAVSWVENKLILLVVIVVVVGGLVYFGKKKIDKLAG